MIAIGYQGVGKSTLARKYLGIIDLESSCFFIDGERSTDWYKAYCNIAIDLSEQGNIVFTSSHKEVREYLAENYDCNKIITITPSHRLKEAWLSKLWCRYCDSNSFNSSLKNLKAYMNARERYDENINEIRSNPNFKHLVIDSIDYNLMDILLQKTMLDTPNVYDIRVFMR